MNARSVLLKQAARFFSYGRSKRATNGRPCGTEKQHQDQRIHHIRQPFGLPPSPQGEGKHGKYARCFRQKANIRHHNI